VVREVAGALSRRRGTDQHGVENGASGGDPALRGSFECSHTGLYAALPKSPGGLADGPMHVFQQPVRFSHDWNFTNEYKIDLNDLRWGDSPGRHLDSHYHNVQFFPSSNGHTLGSISSCPDRSPFGTDLIQTRSDPVYSIIGFITDQLSPWL
jgi:hypothetical protein